MALLSAVRQQGAAATKRALSSLHDQGAPEVPDLDLNPAAAPSTIAAEMLMASIEEGVYLLLLPKDMQIGPFFLFNMLAEAMSIMLHISQHMIWNDVQIRIMLHCGL